jgi:hypothetical protein
MVASVLPVPRRRSPVVGHGVSRLLSFAGAVGNSTGLSLRSPRPPKIFFRDAGAPGAGCAGADPSLAR